jgi:hypothetical protein
MAVYDEEDQHNVEDQHRPGQAYKPEELVDREAIASAIAGGKNPDYYRPEAEAVNKLFNNPEADRHNALVGGLKGKLVKFGSKKILYGGIGAGLATVFVVIGSFLGFLNVFKLDHIMNNVETKAFTRYQVALDGRSDRWIRSYVMIRLSEITDDAHILNDLDTNNRTLLFKSGAVDTNRPWVDWYGTMRASSFEADLKRDFGIEFTTAAYTENDVVKFRPAVITVDGKPSGSPISFEGLNGRTLTPEQIRTSRFGNLTTEINNMLKVDVFENNQDARRAIKRAVNAKTHSWQVIKRRHVRKWIQNKTGVRSWRFFDKTRTRVEEKVIGVRNKIIKAILPDSTVMGRIVQCIFGVTKCRSSSDAANPDTKAGNSATTGENKSQESRNLNDGSGGTTEISSTPEGASAVTEAGDSVARELGEEAIELGAKEALAVEVAKSVTSKLSRGGNILQWVDLLNTLNNTFKSGALTKMVMVSRGIQAIALYQTFMTAADQITTGEVTGEEVGEFMRTMNAVSNSEGWTSVISESSNSAQAEGEVKFAVGREEYCSSEHQEAVASNPSAYENEFHYLCDDKKIGGPSVGGSIENWWNDNIDSTLGPILAVYNDSFLKPVMEVFNAVVGEVTGAIFAVVGWVAPGAAEQAVGDAIGWLIAKIAIGLGAGPIMNGDEPSGVYTNVIIEGAAYSAETSARNSGAAATNSLTRSLSNDMVATYYNDYYDSESVFDKYLSLSNPDSTLSKSLFATVENTAVNNMAGLFSQVAKNIAKIPLNIFSRPAIAGTESSYAAANFAGIETYDFPQECYDLDPLTMTPQDVTNADDSDIIPASELTWDIVNDSEAFNNLLFGKLREMYGEEADTDQYSKPIYNCAAMDSTVLAGLGYVYGYEDEYGGISDDYGGNTGIGSCEGLVVQGPEYGHGGSEVVDGHAQYLLPRNNPGYTTNHNQEQQWGRKELIQTIWQVGLKWNEAHPEGPKIVVAGLDESVGHVSHVRGVDVDFVSGPMYMRAAGTTYDISLSIELAKMLLETGNIDVIFYNDSQVQEVVNAFANENGLPGEMRSSTASHWNHFHIRIKAGVTPLGCE